MTDYVHPGYVISRNDGDRHYVGFLPLCRLYGLNPHKAICVTPETVKGYPEQKDDRHFFPRYDGNYKKVDQE